MRLSLACRFLVLSVIVTVMLPVTSCVSNSASWHETSGAVWGTEYHIKYRADKSLDDTIISTMRSVESAVSAFDPGSEVSRVNRGEPVRVSPMFTEVFVESKRISELSSGAFDPTVAPLVNLWGFGYKKDGHADAGTEPSAEDIRAALALVGISGCRINERGYVEKVNAATEFDFSAIAKGYGVDCVGAALSAAGATDFIVEIGGEVVVKGVNPSGYKWRVQIDRPDVSTLEHSQLRVIGLSAGGVATSGNYRNYRLMNDGRRVGHTISPLTGRPVETSTLSVTVAAPTCMMADGLATACMAMSFDEARKMIQSLDGVWAFFVLADEKSPDGFKFVDTGAWPH